MRLLKIVSAIGITALAPAPAFAQAAMSEPGAFEAAHPDRDVLNGGALTPAARLAARGYTALQAVAVHERGSVASRGKRVR